MTPAELINGLEPLELVSGMVFGSDDSVPEPPRGRGDARTTLERILVDPLSSSPCGVAFSGGRDSSALLATATMVARRLGLADPIPVTFRFPGIADTDETAYQEMVIRHLGIDEWVCLEPADSLDILGEASTTLTDRHGILYPDNIHILVPMFEALGGGALITGAGGDEVLHGHESHDLAAMLTGRRRPSKKLLRQLAKRYLRSERRIDEIRRHADSYFTWLVPEARHEVVERIAAAGAADLLLADRHLTKVVYRARYLHRTQTDMALVAADHGMELAHPMLHPEFVGALADHVGHTGSATRTELMVQLFAGLVPEKLSSRTSKARFDDVFWTGRTAALVQGLSLDRLATFVDEPALRRLWDSDGPKGNTHLIVKYLWHLAEVDAQAVRPIDRPPDLVTMSKPAQGRHDLGG